MKKTGPTNPERAFGVAIGTVLVIVAAWSLWRGRMSSGAAFASAGALLLISGLAWPALLKWPSAIWWRFSRALGHVNARVLLTLIFVLVFSPIGLVWRFIRRDPLGRERARFPGWSKHPARYRDRGHYARMY
jgi:hypothetical protein